MDTSVIVLSVPKAGLDKSEYEDAWAVSPSSPKIFRAAIADGATDSVYSGLWANILVQTYVHSDGYYEHIDFFDMLEKARSEWLEEVQKHKPFPWYVEEKLRHGAHSTLLRLSLFEDGRWEAFGVGDSCMAQVRDDDVIQKFPLKYSSLFNASPYLITSNFGDNTGLLPRIRILEGQYRPFDSFYLMTDALAHWFYLTHERDEQPWIDLEGMQQEPFERFINTLRAKKEIRNDDTTLIRVDVF